MSLPAYAMNAASFPQIYERALVGTLFRPWVDELFDRASLRSDDSVLDIACGTGIVARMARRRLGSSARIVGVDVSAPMLAVAREIEPAIDWREGDAMSLPVADDEKFSVAFCQQGIQFFADKVAAAREMRRVLAPGGRVVVATWLGLERNPLFRDLHEAAAPHVGQSEDERFSFGDAEALRNVLEVGGLRDVSIVERQRTIRMPDAGVLLRLNSMAEVGMSKAAAQLDDEVRMRLAAAVERDSAPVMDRYRDGEGLAFEAATLIASARA